MHTYTHIHSHTYIHTYIHTYVHTYIHTYTDCDSCCGTGYEKITLLLRRVCKINVAVYSRFRSSFGISQIDRGLCACDRQDFCSENNFVHFLLVVECRDIVPSSFLQSLLANIAIGKKIIKETNTATFITP